MLLNNASACGQPATLGSGSIAPEVGARSPCFSRAFARHDPRNFNVAVGVGRRPMTALSRHSPRSQCFARISGTRANSGNRGDTRRARIRRTPPLSRKNAMPLFNRKCPPALSMGDTAATKWDTVSNLSMFVHGCFQSKPMNKQTFKG